MAEQFDVASIVYDCTLAEYKQGWRLLAARPGDKKRRGRSKLKSALIGWVVVIVLLGILCFLQGVTPWESNAARPGGHVPMPIIMGLSAFVLGAACCVIALVWSVALLWKKRNRWHRGLTISFDQNGITQRRLGRTDIFSWSRFRDFNEGPDVFALTTATAARGLIVPKRLFADDPERESVRLLLQQKILPPEKPVSYGFLVILK